MLTPPSTTSPSLPSELITAIVDELSSDHPTLKSCCLVSTDFCGPSQRHLFRAIWVRRPNWQHYTIGQQALHRGVTSLSGTFRQADSILAESPHLAVYVRDLTIDLPDSVDEDVPLTRILEAVGGNLERFVVSGMRVRWQDLSEVLALAVLDAMASSGLRSLHLLSLRDMPVDALYGAMKRVKALSIHSSTFAVPEPKDENEVSRKRGVSPIEHLILSASLRDTYDIILSPHAPVLGNVSKLFIRVPTMDVYADRLPTVVAGTLDTLSLECDLSEPLFLPELPHLRSLTLRMFRGIVRCLPTGLAETLRTLPPLADGLTLIFALQKRVAEPPWPDEGVVLITPGSTRTVRFQALLFDLAPMPVGGLGGERNSAWKERAFEEFRKGRRRAFALEGSDEELKVERVDSEQEAYVARLP
ncbi:hypothetical protein C8F01DRAFT_1369251 [Mycena amicta]|nr:hypothetical protein C8F01DRAFT_1369251 [Mycena amicta]